jgi:hypothetical protein
MHARGNDQTAVFTAAAAVTAWFGLLQCVAAGWSFPWGLRVRLCEMLLRGVFDTLDEATYIDGADAYLQLLQVRPGAPCHKMKCCVRCCCGASLTRWMKPRTSTVQAHTCSCCR